MLDCLGDASLHLDLSIVALVSGHPRPQRYQCTVGVFARDPLGCFRCPGRMASGAERQPLWLRCVGGGGHVMWTLLIHGFLKRNGLRQVTNVQQGYISYIHHTNDFRQHCHVGNTAQHCRLSLFQDSDFVGGLEHSKSTSGGGLVYVRKQNTCSCKLDV